MHNAFTQMYIEYSDQIFRFCMTKLRDRALALDITQETFIVLWDYLKEKRTLDHPRPLLYRIAYNKIVDWSRKKKPVSLDYLLDTGLEFGEMHELESQMSRDDMRMTLRAIEELPDEYRVPLTMRYLDGMSVKEIAEVLEEKANLISVRLHRAIEKVKEILD